MITVQNFPSIYVETDYFMQTITQGGVMRWFNISGGKIIDKLLNAPCFV